MRFGSVCSGIEAASVAWGGLGWKAAWFSEIEPFPSAVLAHHYPDCVNLGDMTALPSRILAEEVEAPDVFCGGTPCQAFSVAGLRKSLADARGNLSLTFCEIADAIDSVRSVRGERPCIVFWENVPGVLSTADNAFGCFLAQLCGGDEPLVAPDGWTDAGVVTGPKRTVAWRVLDAQYFGLAQRRRRVFVVASARNDFDPAAVLLEFDGLRRDSAPSRETGQGAAKCLTAGVGKRFDSETEDFVAAQCIGSGSDPNLMNTLTATDAEKWGSNQWVQEGKAILHQEMSEVAGTLTANAGGLNRPAGNANELDFCVPVMQPIALQDITTRNKSQNGKGWNDDGTAYTVDTHATQGVMQPVAFHPTQDPISSTEVCHSIGANENATAAVMQPIPIDTMNHLGRKDSHSFGDFEPGAPSYTLTKGHSHAAYVPPMQVRRLTPIECERLQGFPDGYTAIPWRGKPMDECPDGPRYKALGNSWAVPVVRWIGRRINQSIKKLEQ